MKFVTAYVYHDVLLRHSCCINFKENQNENQALLKITKTHTYSYTTFQNNQ